MAFNNESPSELDRRSATKWSEKFCQTTPLLIVHGTSDTEVLASHSLELAIKLYENKKIFRLMLLEGGDHNLSNFNQVYRESVKNWFERYLK